MKMQSIRTNMHSGYQDEAPDVIAVGCTAAICISAPLAG